MFPSLIAASFVVVSFAATAAVGAEPLILGANFNETMAAARLPALEAARVTWIRGFLPALEFIDGERRLEDDRQLEAFHTAAEAGHKIVLTIKWDFRRHDARVPEPGCEREKVLFDWAVEAARVGRPDVLCLVNEAFIDTLPDDLAPQADGAIPMAEFLKRLVQHVHDAELNAPDGSPLPISSGGFTQLYNPTMQQRAAVQDLLPWLEASELVDAINLHIHHRSYEEIDESLAFTRRLAPTKPLLVTEFSPVWSYGAHRDVPIGESPAGRAFAEKYALDPQMTVLEYLNDSFADPVSEQQHNDFLESQPWFDGDYLETTCGKMEQRGVVLATYAFVQEASGGRGPLRANSALWCLNPVYAELMTKPSTTNSMRLGANRDLFKTFRARQAVDQTLELTRPQAPSK